MDIGFILTYIVCFTIVACGINLSKNKKSISMMLMAKGIVYFYLAIAIFINILCNGNAERYVIGLTLGIAIIEGSTALKDGIEKMKRG